MLGVTGFMLERPHSAGREDKQERTYDPAVSRAKLARIHQALCLYRQEYGVKAVSDWKSISAAGIPPHPLVLALEGHPWSLPVETFQIEGSEHLSPAGKPPLFGTNFLDRTIVGQKRTETLLKYLPRGEDLIYLWDSSYSPEAQLRQDSWNVLVLRLNGTIEVVRAERTALDGLLGK
ncbi:MAG: hypothetical protein AB7F50_07560 [Fimbriimonadaceae bacterium]